MRKHYIDNLRISIVLLVIVYHVCYIFNGVGVLGGIPNSLSLPICDGFASLVYPWFMVLLFIIAGMSSAYSLEKRSTKEFISSRTQKLLVPSTLGLFVFHFITGLVNTKLGGAELSNVPLLVRYFIYVLSGTGVLWFAQLLWIFSLILCLLRKIKLFEKYRLKEKKSIYLPVIIIYLSSLVLNAPIITVYRVGIYLASYLIGYYVFSDENVVERVEKTVYISLAIALASGVIYISTFYGSDYTAPSCLQNVITNIYAYFTSIFLIGIFKRFFDKTNSVLSYLSASSFGFYVLHYTPILLIGVLVSNSGLNVYLRYLLTLLLGSISTLLLYEVIKRIPFYRYLVLGIRNKR